MARSTMQTVGIAGLTAFLVASISAGAGAAPHPVAAPKHCSVQQCPPAPSLKARVDELQSEVFTLKAKVSCISLKAPMTPDINGDVHPLMKWRKSCVGLK